MAFNLTEKIDFLKSISLFSTTSTEILTQIARFSEETTYPANTFLFHEGEAGDFLYLLITGEASLMRGEIVLKTFQQRGECVGELALLDEGPRSASLMASTELCVLRISLEHFNRLLNENPQFSRELFKVLSFRLREDLNLQTKAICQEAARDRELKLAAEVQRSLFPKEEIRLPKIQTSGHCQQANTVGGDYYDYLLISPDKVGVVIGDVMGHGFHSALFVAMVKSCLQNQIRQASSISKVMRSINYAVEQAQTGIYITICYLLIDFRNQRLSYANAGHPPVYHYRRRVGQIEELKATCMPLGLVSGVEMPRKLSRRLVWEKGDLLLMYSDGITEAENLYEELFGEERLKKAFLANVDRSAEKIKAAILKELSDYCEGKSNSDDVTLVVIKL